MSHTSHRDAGIGSSTFPTPRFVLSAGVLALWIPLLVTSNISPRHSLNSFESLVASRRVVCVVRGFQECGLCRSWLHSMWFVSFVASRSVVCVVRGFTECGLCRSWLHGDLLGIL